MNESTHTAPLVAPTRRRGKIDRKLLAKSDLETTPDLSSIWLDATLPSKAIAPINFIPIAELMSGAPVGAPDVTVAESSVIVNDNASPALATASDKS